MGTNFRSVVLVLRGTASMLNFRGYKFSRICKEDASVFHVTRIHGCGHGNASARDKQGPWQGYPPKSSPVLPSRGDSSAVLPASFVGAGKTPSRFCEQPNCWGDCNSSDTGPSRMRSKSLLSPLDMQLYKCTHTHVHFKVTCANVTQD